MDVQKTYEIPTPYVVMQLRESGLDDCKVLVNVTCSMSDVFSYMDMLRSCYKTLENEHKLCHILVEPIVSGEWCSREQLEQIKKQSKVFHLEPMLF